MQQPTLNPQPLKQFALFELGFRPFFLLASLFSIIATTIWMATYTFGWSLPVSTITPIAWHGHEMVFGYSMAIIAGFLLTAVRNWTGVQTIKGLPLLLLALTWLLARILPLLNSPLLFEWAAIFDIAFLLGLTLAVLHPIAKVKQWRQLLIVSILASILAANILYYLGVFHLVNQGISWGLFSAVYLIMALIFTLARRVMPFFIERGV
ncbi:MAG: NnrS family protein, partial [Gammaproteobacteria bacterium]